jgi:hypothetical protein
MVGIKPQIANVVVAAFGFVACITSRGNDVVEAKPSCSGGALFQRRQDTGPDIPTRHGVNCEVTVLCQRVGARTLQLNYGGS